MAGREVVFSTFNIEKTQVENQRYVILRHVTKDANVISYLIEEDKLVFVNKMMKDVFDAGFKAGQSNK